MAALNNQDINARREVVGAKEKAAIDERWDKALSSLAELGNQEREAGKPRGGGNQAGIEQRTFHEVKAEKVQDIKEMKQVAADHFEQKTGKKLDVKDIEMAQPGKSYQGEIITKNDAMVAQYNAKEQAMVVHDTAAVGYNNSQKLEAGKSAEINYSPGGTAVVHNREVEMQHQGREAARNMESSREMGHSR